MFNGVEKRLKGPVRYQAFNSRLSLSSVFPKVVLIYITIRAMISFVF